MTINLIKFEYLKWNIFGISVYGNCAFSLKCYRNFLPVVLTAINAEYTRATRKVLTLTT